MGNFGVNSDRHPMGKEWKRIHGYGLVGIKQRSIITRNNEMHDDKDIQLGQLVACTHSWPSPEWKEHIRWD
ncbi:hypothetical protein ACFX2I_024416 [Malus domestica]